MLFVFYLIPKNSFTNTIFIRKAGKQEKILTQPHGGLQYCVKTIKDCTSPRVPMVVRRRFIECL